MPVVLVDICCVLGAMLLMIDLLLLAGTCFVKRWKHSMDVSGDTHYAETIATLCKSSVLRHFNPYSDIDWEAPEFCVADNDPRWVLSATDPLGRHLWYQAQPLEKQIAIGMHAVPRRGLMNPVARSIWRICKIDGRPSRWSPYH